MKLHQRREQRCCRLPPEAVRTSVYLEARCDWGVAAGTSGAIGIVSRRGYNLARRSHFDVSASLSSFLAEGLSHLRPYRSPSKTIRALHGGDAHPNHDEQAEPGGVSAGQSAGPPGPVEVKNQRGSRSSPYKGLCAVDVCDGCRNQFEFHLHGRHGCFHSFFVLDSSTPLLV